MRFLEKDLEEIIAGNLFKMAERGLDILGKAVFVSARRQVQLAPYGIADIIILECGYNFRGEREIVITVVECKLNAIDLNAYQQVKRYKAAVNSILDSFNLDNTIVKVKTVLIGSSFCDNGDFPFVYSDDLNCDCYTYSYSIDGIHFKKVRKDWRFTSKKVEAKDLKGTFIRCFKNAYTNKTELVEKMKTESIPF